MDMRQAIDARVSRRTYLDQPVEPGTLDALRAALEEGNARGGVDMRMALDAGGAFAGLRRSYGMFKGVRSYIGLICKENDPLAIERLGYWGERWVLEATALGIGTCWVAGTFDRSLSPFTLGNGDTLVCVITFGPVDASLTFKERLLRAGSHRRTKSIADMVRADVEALPDWFERGMRMVQRAPSAVNRQPVVFTLKDGAASAAIDGQAAATLLDFGIAKLHFEIGADGGHWAWGNGGEFIRD